MDFNNVPDDLKQKALQCKTPEDLLELAQSEGVELSDETLEAISGGDGWSGCPAKDCTDVCVYRNCGTFC